MNISMEKRLILVFILLVIIPITSISYVSYKNYDKTIQSNAIEYVTELSSQLISNLDDYILDMNTIAMIPLYSSWPSMDLQGLLEDPNIDLEKERQMDDYIQLLSNFKGGTDSIYIFDNYGHIFFKKNNEGLRKDINQRFPEWQKLTRSSDGQSLLISTQEVSSTNNAKYVFSIIQDIKNTTTMESVGTIVIDANVKVIEKEVRGLDAVTKGKTLIIDKFNNVIFDSGKQLLTQNLTGDPVIQQAIGDNGSFTIAINGEEFICSYLKSQKTAWKMIVYIPIHDLTKKASATKDFAFIATSVIFVLALFISVYLVIAMTNPLRKLTKLMEKVQKGDWDVRFHVKYKDEAGVLGSSFNRMIKRIKELIEEIHLTNMRKRIAETEALQSQINPHFIYNTLETIRMSALLNDDMEVSEMIYVLGNMMSYSINRGNELVALRDEIEHLHNYMLLQNYRFDNKFEFKVEIPEEAYHFPMIKLIFQPIVENAIFHGLEKQKGSCLIIILVKVEAEEIVFMITDNGIGMNEAELLRLRQQIDKDQYDLFSKHKIGLRNVHQRIKLHYNSSNGLVINSQLKVGTTVTFSLPKFK
ncbi:sensor histidine kinase [Paenibacillus psychroresistens]|nr:sensor histidine kinase [Paenibacillus psychroresistens]